MLRNLHVIITKGYLLSTLGSKSVSKQSQAGASDDQHGPRSLAQGSGSQVPPRRLTSSFLPLGSDKISVQDALNLLAMYLSAIVHDYDHRGVTNPYLIQDEDPLAVRGGEGLMISE